MGSIENEARAKHRTLLVLDTVSGSHAFHLYRRLGWTICGEIPDYAFFPRGGLCTTTIFYKRLSELEPT
jgi:ribosomal protein S18 acetylase RimI-like enzyme